MLVGLWLILGLVYLFMTFIAYSLVKPEYKMSVLSGWWCFNKNIFSPKHHLFVLAGKILMVGILVCAVSYFIGYSS